MRRLILFDIDGTLLISRGIGREAKRRAMLEHFGQAGDLDQHVFGGKTDWQILADLLTPHGYSSADIGREMQAYEIVMARHMRRIQADFQAQPLPHAMPLIAELRARDDVTLGLVSGNTSMTAAIKLEMAGFKREWFAVGAFGNEAADRSDLTRLAVKRGRAAAGHDFAGREIVIIGDTPADIAAARAVNAVAVAVDTGYSSRESLISSRPDLLLDDLGGFADRALG